MKKAKAAAKTPHPTTEKTKTEKTPVLYLGDYFCMKELQPRPVTLLFLEILAQKLVDWCELETSLSLTQFLRLTKISWKDYYRWKNRSELLQKAHEYALGVVGDRREIGALKNKFNTYTVFRSLHSYADHYKQDALFAASLAKHSRGGDDEKVRVVVIKDAEVTEDMKKLLERKGEDDDLL